MYLTGTRCSCGDKPDPVYVKASIYRETKVSGTALFFVVFCGANQMALERIQTLAGQARYVKGSVFPPASWFNQRFNLLQNLMNSRCLYPVDLIDHNAHAFYTQNFEDINMLKGLGHRPIISGYYQKPHIDTADTRNHGVDKLSVTGNVDKPQSFIGPLRKKGVTQINR